MSSNDIHRCIRAVTKHYPTRRLAPQFATLMAFLFPAREPLWMVSQPHGRAPLLELNLSHPHQRKIYYFPKAWGNYWMRERFPRFMEHELSQGKKFMDIGAHLGFFTFYAAQLLGDRGSVIAFEANPEMYESLDRSARLHQNYDIVCAGLALSDRNGDALFYRAKKPAASSLVPEKCGHEKRYDSTVKVSCRRLDDYITEIDFDLDNLQLIKCDVEGNEVKVVAGMLDTLVKAEFPVIWAEVRGPEGSTRAPNTYPAVNQMLSELGYRPYFWRDGHYSSVSEGDVVGRVDVVFRHDSPVSVAIA